MSEQRVRLTTLSHGGGCGCKVAPAALAGLLDGIVTGPDSKNLLAGNSTREDAAVFAFGEARALVATTDFFTPIVDDPGDFGRIAAANAISDVYAMGAQPLFALNVVGMPIDKLPASAISAVLKGGQSICREAGILIVGGHSIDLSEPIYGLAVVGEVHPEQVKYNAGARCGDRLILSKPLGVGVIATAIKRQLASSQAYRQMLHWATLLNRTGEKLASIGGVHAMTDVSGYGLLGHLIEMCEASGVGARVCFSQVPVIEAAHDLLGQGVVSPAAARNRDSYVQHVALGQTATAAVMDLLYDPQTNGGLLVSCAPDDTEAVLDCFRRDGCDRACVIGEVQEAGGITID